MSNKKKLVYVVTKSSWGGAQRYVYDLALSFQNEYEVEIWCGQNEISNDISLISRAKGSGICVRYIEDLRRDVNLKKEIQVWHNFFVMVNKHQPDILHLNSTKIGCFGSIIGRMCRVKKIVFTAHGLANFEDRPRLQKFLIRYFNRLIFILMHDVILISKFEFSYTRNWYGSSKHKLIYNGISHLEKRPFEFVTRHFPNTIRKKFNKPHIKHFIGIGELHKNKGLTYTLQAFHNLKMLGYDFMYVHFGDGELKQQLLKQVAQLGLEENIYFFGFIDNASAYLSYFDGLVFSSIKEGLPYVVIEAGYAGIPVFASCVGGIPEIIIEGQTGKLHEPKDIMTLTNHLIDFIMSGTYKQEDIIQKVTNRFSIEKMLKKTKILYES